MTVNIKAWEAERTNGLILVAVPACNWARACHDWELHRMRAYLQEAKQIPVEIRLAIFAWLEQVEAAIEISRQQRAEQAERTDRMERTCIVLMGLVGIGLMVTCFLLAGGVL
jgi:hypothetical protein